MQIGPYLVQSELGRGGKSVVYEVVDGQGRSFALKRLPTEVNADDQPRLRRIGRELEALGRIQHPGLVRVLDSGWDSGAFYVVTELVRAPSLGARLQRQGALPAGEAARLCLGLAQTLHALHGQGILHRDLRPAKVFVDGGRPRLADLGLVQLYDEPGQQTPSGAALGTPGYCAPELLSRSGAEPTAAVDVYGLGATLYALLTGHPPYEGASGYEVAVKALEGPPIPPSRRLAGEGGSDAEQRVAVARFDELVLRCLAQDPGDRYRRAEDVAIALEELLRAGESGPEAEPKLLFPLLVVVALGLVVGALYAVLSSSEPADQTALATPGAPEASQTPGGAPRAEPSAAPAQETPASRASPSSRRRSAQVEDFLAPGSGPGPAPPASLEVRGLEDLQTLGRLAPYVWKGRGPTWELSKEPQGFVGLRSVPNAGGGISIRYFELRRAVVGKSLSARVTVEVDPGQGNVSGGLIYGRTDRRDYYLIGLSNLGARFVKHRTREGLQDRVSGTLEPGPHSFGVNEVGDRLSLSVDGRTIMQLGGAADPEARVGVFVIGAGLVKARQFELELR